MKKILLCVFILLLSVNVFAGDVDIERLTEMANNGDAEAQYQLSKRYYQGNSIAQDYKMAVYWQQEAAKQGHTEAQFVLGLCCYDGFGGLPQNNKLAYMWISLALARTSDTERKEVFKDFLEIFESEMTPAEIAEAQQMADEWMERHR